jgi:hypothetical protein
MVHAGLARQESRVIDRKGGTVPISRGDTIAFVVGLAVIAALTALLFAWQTYRRTTTKKAAVPAVVEKHRPQPQGEPAASSVPIPPARTQRVARAAPPVPSAPTPHPSPKPAATPELRLVAARGDCWLEVHAGSQQGKTLYIGLLQRGRAVTLPAKLLWVRFGAPENLDAAVAGRKVALPRGASNALITPRGVAPASS